MKLTRKQDDTESPEHFHPAQDFLSVFGLLELSQVREANTHSTGNAAKTSKKIILIFLITLLMLILLLLNK